MRIRVLALAAVALAALALAPAGAAKQTPSWAQEQIRAAVQTGLMGPSVKRFRADEPLTREELARIVAGLTREEQVVVDPDRAVSVQELDAALVRVLGLAPATRRVRAVAAAAGLRPTRRLGTETVARMLELRTNHPAEEDGRELLPTDPVTRAETAHSLARLLELGAGDLDRVRAEVGSLALPRLDPWQRRVLARALSFVGYPYVWGGSSERAQAPFGVASRGGFDCSGFAWRVYRLEPFAGAPSLAAVLRGRTTYAMSAESPRRERIPLARLAPGDLVFFGDRGPRSKPSQVGHMGIYVGGGWFVHSSGQGTTLRPLDGWYAETFAWGRRPLAEAGFA